MPIRISPEIEELIAQAWAASIPERFRYSPELATNPATGAILAPPPPRLKLRRLERFFRRISEGQHLTAKQLSAQIGKNGRRKDILTSAEVG
jgi:hypothetical protein